MTSVITSFVTDGSIDLYNLRQDDLEKCLAFIVSQKLCRLILSRRNRLNSGTIDLCKICGIVQRTSENDRSKSIHRRYSCPTDKTVQNTTAAAAASAVFLA